MDNLNQQLIVQALRNLAKDAEDSRVREMYVGRRIGPNLNDVTLAGAQYGYTWVRDTLDNRNAIQARGVYVVLNEKVEVREDRSGELVIVRSLTPGSGEYRDGKLSALTVYGTNFSEGRVILSDLGGLNVTVEAFTFNRVRIPKTDLLLTPPGTAGKSAACAVVYRPLTNTFAQVTGALQDTGTTLSDADWMATLTFALEDVPLGAYVLANGQTTITGATRFVDVRTFVESIRPLHNYAGTAAPTATNDSAQGYSVGSVWIDTTNDRAYLCADATAGAAVWKEAGGGALTVREIDGVPTVANVQTIRFPNGTVTDLGGGVVEVQAGGSISVTDTATTVNPATTARFDPTAFDVDDLGGGTALVKLLSVPSGVRRVIPTILYDSGRLGSAGAFDTGTMNTTGYLYLQVWLWNARSSVAAVNDGFSWLFNADIAGTDDTFYVAVSGNNGSNNLGAITNNNRNAGVCSGSSATADFSGWAYWTIPDPASTLDFKEIIAGNNSDMNTVSQGFQRRYNTKWERKVAINRIRLTPDASPNTFAAGARMLVLGYREEPVGGAAVNPATAGGRLTVTSGTPVTTTDVSNAQTLFYTPFVGDRIALFSSGVWQDVQFTEKSIKLTDTQTGTTTSASTSVTGLVDTSQLVVGMQVTGTGIPADTTIAAITSGTAITLSAAATASGSTALTFRLRQHQAYDVYGYLSGGELKLEWQPWTANPTGAITAVTNANPPVLTSNAHGLAVDDIVTIAGVGGATGVNGTFRVSAVTANTFTLVTLANANPGAPGVYTSGGRWWRDNQVGSRSVGITRQDGVWIKTGDATRRYLGTVLVGATAGALTDSDVLRGVFNAQNRMPKAIRNLDQNQHTYNAGTVRAWNNDFTARSRVIVGVSDTAAMWSIASYHAGGAGGATPGLVGGAVNSISSFTTFALSSANTSVLVLALTVNFTFAVGCSYIQMLEIGNATNPPLFVYAGFFLQHQC